MTMTHPISDMITRIRHPQRARKRVVRCPASKFRANVLTVLEKEGYIRGFSRHDETVAEAAVEIELKYHEGEPVIRRISRVSKPGRRVYSSIKELPRLDSGLGISILSTPRGVMSDSEARAANVGGEILCYVF